MSATGTAIQIRRVRPREAILMSAVLAAVLGVGFFAGRATESAPSTAQEGVSVAIPEVGLGTEGAAVKERIYERTFGTPTNGTGDSTGEVVPRDSEVIRNFPEGWQLGS